MHACYTDSLLFREFDRQTREIGKRFPPTDSDPLHPLSLSLCVCGCFSLSLLITQVRLSSLFPAILCR